MFVVDSLPVASASATVAVLSFLSRRVRRGPTRVALLVLPVVLVAVWQAALVFETPSLADWSKAGAVAVASLLVTAPGLVVSAWCGSRPGARWWFAIPGVLTGALVGLAFIDVALVAVCVFAGDCL